jgi:superfamily II DNA or RNA helicase
MTDLIISKNIWQNLLENNDSVELSEFLAVYKNRLTQDSEKLFVSEFLYPILGKKNIQYVIPQYPFIDSEGKNRRIDFVIIKDSKKVALEVNGETYHAEGIIPNEMFDDNLNRQNDILNAGYRLLRFSYSQLQSPAWRKRVFEAIRKLIQQNYPELISATIITPNYLQEEVLKALDLYRERGWQKGIVVLPTGTGKTYLSAFDTLRTGGRILFIVHRLDILSQSREAFEKIYPMKKLGLLTGECQEYVEDSKVLFASKDSLRNPDTLKMFNKKEFAYIIVDEVHHGQAPSYKLVLDYFEPTFFMLGLTATPDRMDRKDIFELFDYNKIFEYSLIEAIENGFLVPFDYYGLKDNVDYTNIRYKGAKYNVQDLDRYLIINERNEQILEEYLKKGQGNKAIGFCCSIKHAERMAAFFNRYDIPSVAITSLADQRTELTTKFKNNEVAVAFTVDIFNEGVDFPDVQVLMFLRPTESKTIFMQQLGRGLRLCGSKSNVVVLDFISNYKKANSIRKYLSKSSKEFKNPKNGRIEKVEYQYSPKCNVYFDSEVEQILDAQDRQERGITKEDLIGAYYDLAESLQRKPTQEDINQAGEFKIARYLSIFGSWVKFLREIGEFTEASYHFPQGLHLGHLLYIIKTVSSGRFRGSHLDERFVRMRGNLGSDRLGAFQRQTKYKLQGLMELGLLVDDRTVARDESFKLKLAPKGHEFYEALKPIINKLDLSFKDKNQDIPSWDMNTPVNDFNLAIRDFLKKDKADQEKLRSIFLEMHAVRLMLNYLYRVERQKTILKSNIYAGFFRSPEVSKYCDQNGIEEATEEGAKHRCPFLLNILEAMGVLENGRTHIELQIFLVSPSLLKAGDREPEELLESRFAAIKKYSSGRKIDLEEQEISVLKEMFGKDFLTPQYFLNKFEFTHGK